MATFSKEQQAHEIALALTQKRFPNDGFVDPKYFMNLYKKDYLTILKSLDTI